VGNALKMRVFAGLALLCAGGFLAGCKSAPDLTASQAQSLIQAKYDADAAAGVPVTVTDLGMQQGFTAKYWTRTKQFPNKYWADFTLTDDGKKVIKLENGGSVIEWRPSSPDDKTFSVVVTTVAENHLKARDPQDPQNESDGTRTVVFNESHSLDGVPAPLQEIARDPGNRLSAKRTATFVLDNGAWKLQSIT
jgi:hypothetical protein